VCISKVSWFSDKQFLRHSTSNELKSREKEKNPVSPRRDAPVHTCAVAMAKLNGLKFPARLIRRIWPRRATSPCSQTWKKLLGEEKYVNECCCRRSREWLFFRFGEKTYFSDGMWIGLEKRWTKRIELKKGEITLKNWFCLKKCVFLC